MLVALLIGCCTSIVRAEEPDFTAYRQAVEYCRGDVPRPMALSVDKRILCFDGPIWGNEELSVAKDFSEGGLFVVRSPGGYPSAARPLADYLQMRQAIVVVYDYCLSACAEYLLLASERAIVLRDSLVAWHYTPSPDYCPKWIAAADRGPKRFQKVICSYGSDDNFDNYQIASDHADFRFFRSRLKDPEFAMPPESVAVRARLKKLIDGSASCPIDLLWMWHPRYYSAALKTQVAYEHYPESQREVDVLASKLGFLHLFYDP